MRNPLPFLAPAFVVLVLSIAVADDAFSPEPRKFGIVANGCFAAQDPRVVPGQIITVISFDEHGASFLKESKVAGDCPEERVFPFIKSIAHRLEADDAEGIGTVGSGLDINRENGKAGYGDDRGDKLTFTECASSEGLHRNVWILRDGKRIKVWHGYRYLRYNVEPNCTNEEIADPTANSSR